MARAEQHRWVFASRFRRGAFGWRSQPAIRLAESCRRQDGDDRAIALVCEEILLSSGLAEEAYERYAIVANQRSTYLATFRTITGKYPHKRPAEVLRDLVASTPGQEGKWFAAAKDAKFYDVAIQLAGRSPCDPRTLTGPRRTVPDGAWVRGGGWDAGAALARAGLRL